METFPTYNEFKALLANDLVFRDHFNVFLQLPIFARRFSYSNVTKLFDVCPYPTSNFQEVDHHCVWQWIYLNRLPLFWTSEFYYGYRLCYEFYNRNSKSSSTEEEGFEGDLQKFACTTKDFQKFILFLRCSPGEAYCLLWMSLEKLRLMDGPAQQKKMISRIKELYLMNGAPFQLEMITRKDILLSISDTETLKDEVANLVSAQTQILESLISYWYQQFTSQVLKSASEEELNIDNELEKSGLLEYRNVIVDHGDEVINITVPPSSTRRKLLTNNPVLGGIKKNGYYRVSKADEEPAAGPLISQSTQKLFSMSSETSTQPSLAKSSSLSLRLKPFIQASIRCNFAAGNPILEHFNRRQLEKPRNLLLFWQSTELILTSDEMKRWYNGIKQAQSEPVCPYLSLFPGYPLATNLEMLLELFIDDNSEFYIELPSEMQRQLHILLPRGLGRRLLLDVQDYACKALEPFWERYILADNNAFQIDCVCRKDISHFSDEIQREQSMLFHKSQVPKELLQSSFDPAETNVIKSMWQSVEYSEVIENPGLLHLPSRISMNLYPQPTTVGESFKTRKEKTRVPTPGDIGPIIYRGITLTPMITTIKTSTQRTPHRMTRSTVYSSQPAMLGELLKKKPPIPRSFSGMMKTPGHLEYFYHFLSMLGNGVEMNVVFWLAIEDMKDSIGDTKACATKIRRIMRRFFKQGIDITLHCQDTSLLELVGISNPSPFQLMDAQEAVAKLLETRWFTEYVKFLRGDYLKEEKPKAKDASATKAGAKPRDIRRLTAAKINSGTGYDDKTPMVKQQTKVLWNIFIRSIINFKRGIRDPKTLSLYKKFLTTEVLNGDVSGKNKKLIGNRLINVTKLLNDLSFWAEVERYKDMADVANAAKGSGHYTPEDEIMIHKKAHAIINCYIDSSVPPRIQVNAPNEVVAKILENLYQGTITRSLFHEAALSSFQVLMLYWKKFLIWRWAPKTNSCASLHSLDSSSRWSGINTIHVDTFDSQMMLDGCILSFSLKSGLRLIKPTSCDKPIPVIMPSFSRTLTHSTVYRLQHSLISNHMNQTEGLVQ